MVLEARAKLTTSGCGLGPRAAGARAPRRAANHALSIRIAAPKVAGTPNRAVLDTRASKVVGASRPAGLAPLQAHSEQTYIMVKPDGVQRGLVGEIISRFEKKGFTLKGLQMCICDKAKAEEHYRDLEGKPFFPNLVDYICSGPVVCMVWEGTDVVKAGRNLIGVTNPTDAAPGTIRGDFGVEVGRNLVHGSDSVENGAREISLWFGGTDTVEWEPTMTPWIKELS